MGVKKRRRVEPTEDWGQLELLLDWPEQVEYERIRDVVVFGSPWPSAPRIPALRKGLSTAG